uniref:Kinesin motor domain-containing protein n=1 Tax=Steinernema glaseri TaxID=37863 RepID=A0A1I7ZW38_9BILA
MVSMLGEASSLQRPPRPPAIPLRRRAISATDLRALGNQPPPEATIKVFARLRPVPDEPVCELVVESDGRKSVIVDKNKFSFFDVLGACTTQTEVFDIVGQPLLDSFLEGYNVCLMAYGHTCSGKTHSMSGTYNDPGIIPRFCDRLWKRISGGQVTASFFEIYQEKVYDLLSATRQPLRIRGMEQPYVEGMRSVVIEDAEQFEELLSVGWTNRATSATVANDRSSRSHALFTIRYTRQQKVDEEEATVSSTCYFVDLAGSEKTPLTGVYRDESVAINVSLTELRRVVMARASNPSGFVSCRGSALTRLLQGAFIGNSRTCVLATLAPSKEMQSETLATLRFAANASKVELKAEVQVNKTSFLQKENVRLMHLLGSQDTAELEEKLRREARAALQEEVAGEVETLKKIIDGLKEQLEEQKMTAAEKERVAEEMQTFVLMQNNLQGQTNVVMQQIVQGSSANEASLAEAEIAVAIANDVLESFGKKAIFSFKLELSDNLEYGLANAVRVRLMNRKQRISADLTLAEFYGLKTRLCEAYGTSLVDGENLGVVERLLYSENWHWNRTDSRKSNLFNTAMINSLRMTANARKSSVAHIRKSLAFRRTSIFSPNMEPVEEKTDEVFDFMNLNFATALKSAIEDAEKIATESMATWLARNIDTVQKTHEHLRAIEQKIMQDKGAILLAKYDALGAIKALVEGVSGARNMEAFQMATTIFSDMLQAGTTLTNSLDSWNHSLQEGIPGEMFLENMEREVQDLFYNLGKFVFWAGANPPDFSLNEGALKTMNLAMRTELTTISGVLEKRVVRVRQYTGFIFRAVLLLGEAFLVIQKDFMKAPWNYTVMNTILWPLYRLIRAVMKVRSCAIPQDMIDTVKELQLTVREEIRAEDVKKIADRYFEDFLKACFNNNA